ncbi:DEAD/DEAH box helicase family protein [Hydrogenimonas thermophila]|uniref:restriction endonuclease n=1 Tax=Hydrogenimonas thermophila TaxID=223786 RepID=UPI002937096C|nr:DEAD/DEAH box helicase family protein [Hydrogenimonas thermophila]WOE71130.1 DEAD/DEAH box helicase family protein [Hydrogenimonas thermophila]WOE73647.1 DEAD/DEAH box helicase family protein [Hydrogenimonas thermophila]
MKLKFKEQSYQLEAVDSIFNIFDGQPKYELLKTIFDRELKKIDLIEEEIIYSTFSNPKLRLSDEEILKNVQTIQKQNRVPISKKLDLENGVYNFSVEMETGTGKTYVYTRTIFELNERYGFSKFIIMTPSVAIREGVHKSLEITETHFKEIYGKKLRFFIYDTKNQSNLTNIRSFAESQEISVIIMNYQAFATTSKDARKIYEELDLMNSHRPIDVIKSTRPILILDEPQKFGATANKKLKEFNPLFILRYSATHKKEYNLMYRLDAIDAFNQKLVKKIGLKAINIKNTTATRGFVYLDEIIISKDRFPKARIEFEIKGQNIKRGLKLLKEGDNLYELSNYLAEYKDGFVIKEINGLENRVTFLNGISLRSGESIGEVDEDLLRRIQIRETIKSHFEKEERLFEKGIKVLSLFFIDEVKKYRDYEKDDTKGEYAKIFEEEFLNVKEEMKHLFNNEYFEYLDKFSIEELHNGYFSIDKKGKLKDPKIDKDGNAKDEDAYELIMKDKERLLSFETPTRFIFSHSALREGWDNPNIFQICTLRHTKSTISKRQEIGRGLRICVDKDGQRMDVERLSDEFFDINALTIIANESYEEFAKKLQSEYDEILSNRRVKFTTDALKGLKLGEKIVDDILAMDLIYEFKSKGYIDNSYELSDKLFEDIENGEFKLSEELNQYRDDILKLVDRFNTKKINIENEKDKNIKLPVLKPNKNFEKFKTFWDKIKFKTTYRIDFDSNELVKNVVDRINRELEVKKIVVNIVESSQEDNVGLEVKSQKSSKVALHLKGIKYDLIGEISKSTYLKRETVGDILKSINKEKFDLFKQNPEDFISKIVHIIEEEKATTFINSIKYTKTGEFNSDIFTINNFKGKLEEDLIDLKKHIYDYLKFDSKVEEVFAKNLDVSDEVVVFAKLPHKFKIPTPAGYYNPDFGILFKDTIYFIAETKGSLKSMELKGKEKAKIEYAKKHFEMLKSVKYKVVTNFDDLINSIGE